MAEIKRIDHIALVVEDIPTALEFWHDALGLELEGNRSLSCWISPRLRREEVKV